MGFSENSAQGPPLFQEEELRSQPNMGQQEIGGRTPLAARMRPRSLEEFLGQHKIVGEQGPLRQAILRDDIPSVLFWGPPGCGKSTLAQIIARTTKSHFESYSALTLGVAEARKIVETARRLRQVGRRTILFLDEIHRWNRAQQDALLEPVENGILVLIGATTENPYFTVAGPLLSRMQLFRFEPLEPQTLYRLLERALHDEERGLGSLSIVAEPEALELLAVNAHGDARRALNALEAVATLLSPDAEGRRHLTSQFVRQHPEAFGYDRSGDEHYNTISAFIKSVRGSDPDAALYWLAKMLEGGEDVGFIARRLLILAAEDIGNADPMGLVVASAMAEAVERVGLPEARILLAQATTYLAAAPKSNAAYLGIERALAEIRAHGAKPVPAHLLDAHSVEGHFMQQPYLYPHDYPGHYVDQSYLPDGVQGLPFYQPTEQGYEAQIKQRLEARQHHRRPLEEEPPTA